MIDTSNWKEFRVGDLFKQERGKEKAPKQNSDGNCPLIQETNTNNGFDRMVVPTTIFRGNAITISINYASNVFYQAEDFCASVNIAIIRNDNLNKYNGYFIATVLSALHRKYDYQNKISKELIDAELVKLPVTPTGEPDWDYMESYMKNIMEKSEKNIENLRKANGHSNPIDVREWGEFRIGDLLEMQKQIELNPIDAYSNNDAHNIRKYPFYGQSSENNGIIDYYYLGEDLLNNKKAKSSIMIHSNTHLAYYVDTPFYLKDGHGATTIFQNESMTLYSAFFIISVLNKTMNTKFDYDVKATKEKLNALVIKLPITSTGEPDWDYMEEYMKNIEEDVKEKVNMLSV